MQHQEKLEVGLNLGLDDYSFAQLTLTRLLH